MYDVHKEIYHNVKHILIANDYVPISISRRYGEWRVIFMDNSKCPFTLDSFYSINLGFTGKMFSVDYFIGIENLTEFERCKLPKERMEKICEFNEEHKQNERKVS